MNVMAITRADFRVWPLAFMLAATLSWKVATVEQGFAIDQASVPIERQHIIDWLRRDRFSVEVPPDNGIATVSAHRNGCDMTIIAVDPRGFHRQLVATMRPARADLFFVYKGNIYPEQPVPITLLAHHFWARSRDLGIRLPRYLVLGVISTGCREQEISWAELGRIS
jgi:hypothetical protein